MADQEQAAAEEKKTDAVNENVVLDEVRDAYERARTELKETTDRLRSELKNIDVEKVGESAKTWVKENPGLAFFLAVGAGMLAGRAITKAMEPPPPPSLSRRARNATGRWADSARHLAGDAQDRLSRQAMEAGEHMADRMKSLRDTVQDKADSIGSVVHHRANDMGVAASEKAQNLIASFTDAAEQAADSLQVAARDLSKSLKKNRKTQQNLFELIVQAGKTILGAFLFKRLSDWVRERY